MFLEEMINRLFFKYGNRFRLVRIFDDHSRFRFSLLEWENENPVVYEITINRLTINTVSCLATGKNDKNCLHCLKLKKRLTNARTEPE